MKTRSVLQNAESRRQVCKTVPWARSNLAWSFVLGLVFKIIVGDREWKPPWNNLIIAKVYDAWLVLWLFNAPVN